MGFIRVTKTAADFTPSWNRDEHQDLSKLLLEKHVPFRMRTLSRFAHLTRPSRRMGNCVVHTHLCDLAKAQESSAA